MGLEKNERTLTQKRKMRETKGDTMSIIVTVKDVGEVVFTKRISFKGCNSRDKRKILKTCVDNNLPQESELSMALFFIEEVLILALCEWLPDPAEYVEVLYQAELTDKQLKKLIEVCRPHIEKIIDEREKYLTSLKKILE